MNKRVEIPVFKNRYFYGVRDLTSFLFYLDVVKAGLYGNFNRYQAQVGAFSDHFLEDLERLASLFYAQK